MKKSIILMMILLVVAAVPCFAETEIVLMAPYATLVTDGALVLEPANNNVGWWETVDDQIIWRTEVPRRGNYEVKIVYSVAEEFAGSTVDVAIGDKNVEWVVESTTDWGSYTTVNLGKVNLDKGEIQVKLQATDIPDRFVANVQVVILTR